MYTEQKSLDSKSFEYGNIPLVVNTKGEYVIRLHHKNAKYLSAYAAANPRGKDHTMAPLSPLHVDEFEGYMIANGNDKGKGKAVEARQMHLYRISESPQPALASPVPVDDNDIEEFTENEVMERLAESPTDAIIGAGDFTMASPAAVSPPHTTQYPTHQTFNDVFSTPPIANRRTMDRMDFVLPKPVARPRGDVAPTRPRDGLERADQLRRQHRRVAATPVNPDVFYRKNNQATVSKLYLIPNLIDNYSR